MSAAGDLLVHGWALAPRGLESVTFEVEQKGKFSARTGLRRPDIHRAFHPAPWSVAPGFDLMVPTAGWLPGVYRVRVTARDGGGSSFTHHGAIEWWPSPAQLSGAYAAGIPALWVGEPRYDAELPCGEAIAVHGWARGPVGVRRVAVELEGVVAVDAFIGISVHDLDLEMPANAPSARAFATVLEAGDLRRGHRQLSVTAFGGDGLSSRRSGALAIDSAARYRALFRPRTAPDPATASSAPRVWRSGDGESLTEALDGFLAADDRVLLLTGGDDTLGADALQSFSAAFAADPALDLAYGDHERLDADGARAGVALKPGWSPELLLGLDYIGAVVALGREAGEAARRHGAPRSVRELLISIADEPLSVLRLPEPLSSRRQDAPPDATGEHDALRALARRRGHELEVGERDDDTGVRDLRWRVSGEPQVSIVIPTTGRNNPLAACLGSIRERTSYAQLEVVLVDSGEGAGDVAAGELGPIAHRTISFEDDRFNFSRACNLGSKAARGEYVVFLNDDTRVESEDWLELMLGQCQLPGTGIVGSRLIFGGGLIQNAGLVLDRLWPPPSRHFVAAAYAYRPAASKGYRGMLATPRDVAAVTGACAMISTRLLEDLGGWDERLRMDYGDVDLSLRAHAAGQRVVIEPRAVLIHDESATQGYGGEDRSEDRRDDRRAFLDRWRESYGGGDRWYHPRCAFDRDWAL